MNKPVNWQRSLWFNVAILFIGASFRIPLLNAYRFHPDEALFASLARLIVEGRDPLLIQTNLLVDKPPLFYYLLAGGITMGWGLEMMARIPALFASVLTIALLIRLGHELWGDHLAGMTAGLLFACSPYTIRFGASVFADPPMVLFFVAGLLAARKTHPGWAGALMGLSIASKQNAVLLLPLPLLLVLSLSFSSVFSLKLIGRFLICLLLPLSLLLVWDAARPGISFLTDAVYFNNPGRLIRSDEIWPRALAWWGWFKYMCGYALPSVSLLALSCWGGNSLLPDSRTKLEARLILAFCLGYFCILWLVAFPILDRYLLPLSPLLALLVGAAVSQFQGYLKWRGKLILIPLILGFLIVPGLQQLRLEQVPVGGDSGAYDGLDQIATFLSEVPAGAVLYTQSLGWPLSYYLFGQFIFVAPIGSPEAFSDDLAIFGGPADSTDRYLLLAGWESSDEPIRGLTTGGYHAELKMTTYDRHGNVSFLLYHLIVIPSTN